MKQCIAIIPARSGSKEFPGKNVVLLGAHPLLTYSIAVAKLAGIERVIVSTDSEEYAAVARQYGAETPFLRPNKYAYSSSHDFHWINFTIKKLSHYNSNVVYLS